jgi:hypothetical protein
MDLIFGEFMMTRFIQNPLGISLNELCVSLFVFKKFSYKFLISPHHRIYINKFADISRHFPHLFLIKKFLQLSFIAGIYILISGVISKIALSE